MRPSRLRRRLAVAAIGVVLAACGNEPDAELEALRQTRDFMPPDLVLPQLRAATADLGYRAARPSPAPAGESVGRRGAGLPAPDVLRVVVGRQVADGCDEQLMAAFEMRDRDVRVDRTTSTERQAVELVMLGRADLGLIGGELSQRERQLGLVQTRLGVELFALAVPTGSPVRTLDRDQIRRIFTGQVDDWRQLGLGSGPILAMVPADPALAERAARSLIPGDRFATGLERTANRAAMLERLSRVPGSVGVVRLTDTALPEQTRPLLIDRVEPSPSAFVNGSYPYGVALQLVTAGAPSPLAQRFLQFARSPAGREQLGAQRTFCAR